MGQLPVHRCRPRTGILPKHLCAAEVLPSPPLPRTTQWLTRVFARAVVATRFRSLRAVASPACPARGSRATGCVHTLRVHASAPRPHRASSPDRRRTRPAVQALPCPRARLVTTGACVLTRTSSSPACIRARLLRCERAQLLKPEIYPLFATLGLATAVCAYAITREFTCNPKYTIMPTKRSTQAIHETEADGVHFVTNRVIAHTKSSVNMFPFNYKPIRQLERYEGGNCE